MNETPHKGLSMIVMTIFVSLALLIYIGADYSENRIKNRANQNNLADVWWERSFILVCPLH
jgi:hypothetical protein